MDFILRVIYLITILLPVYLLGNFFVPRGLDENLPLAIGVVLQVLAGIAIFLYSGKRDGEKYSLVQFGYILFFAGLTGSYFSGKSLYLPFFWEFSTLGGFLVFLASEHRHATTMSLIALLGASGISCTLLASWVLLPDGNPYGIAYFLLALLIKSAFSVLHLWYPDLHEGSPSSASAAFSGVAINLPLLLFAQYFQPEYLGETAYKILVPIAGIGIFLGGVTSFFSKDIKRILAYSTIEKVNFLWLCLFLHKLWTMDKNPEMNTLSKFFLVLFYLTLVHHALSKTYQFLIFGTLRDIAGTNFVDAAKGVGRLVKLPFILLGLGTFSFALLPGTLGFISEATYLYLISRVVDLDSGKSIVILPSMVIFILGLALGSVAHLRLYLSLTLSIPGEELRKVAENKNVSQYVKYSLQYLGFILTFLPVGLAGYLSLSEFTYISDTGLKQWFYTLFYVSVISIIFYIFMLYGKVAHKIEKRQLWDCGSLYRGTELSIPASVISEPLHDSLGLTTRLSDGDSTVDEWLKHKILKVSDLGKIWIREVESGDISNYIAFSSIAVLLTVGLIVLLKFLKESSWNILTYLF